MKRIGVEEEEAVLEVLRREPVTLSGFYKDYDGGPSIQAFERALAKYVGVPFAKTCTNGTSALQLALMAAGIGRGSRVVTTPLTFSATASAIEMVGGEVVFVDVEQESYNLDPNALRKLCEKQKIDAVIPVHLLGVPCKMNEIMTIAEEYNLIVIEDNAQALGADFNGTKTGAWGDLATVSFQETKVISTLGEGGAVLTSNPVYADRIRALRNHGQQYPNPESGVPSSYLCHNFRMTEAQAAMGLVQLKKLDAWNKAQVENREILKDKLEPFGFTFQEGPKNGFSTYYILGTTTENKNREGIVKQLHEFGWGAPKPGATIGLGYGQPIYRLPLLKKYYKYCPVAEWLCGHFMWFDVHRWQEPRYFVKVANQIRMAVHEYLTTDFTA